MATLNEYWIEYTIGRTYDAHWMPTLAAGFSLQTFVTNFKQIHRMDDVRIVVMDPVTNVPVPGKTWLMPGSAVRVRIETLS